ncbi:MAG: thiamine diphosphokinase, partial [Lachnospiraceae bacterium]|nr:thiamine diphosphokinase [Lachnospiraceae bacterium]
MSIRLCKRCFIIGAGDFDGFADAAVPGKDDLIIAADGGYQYLKAAGVEPDVLLGDFDSLKRVPEHRHLIRHSPIKDDTDMALAAAYAENNGCEVYFLYGGLGGRLDHTLANLQLLTRLARKGMEAYLIGKDSMITALTDGKL